MRVILIVTIKSNTMNHRLFTGLEGSRKSITAFEQLKDLATVERPLLIGVKNYALMQEQIDTWCSIFDLDRAEFNICGFGNTYEPAMLAYTNPGAPYMAQEGVRFIFMSQANIQRNNHLALGHSDGGVVNYCHILIDEFEFFQGVIPSAHYQLDKIMAGDVKDESIDKLVRWVEKNYTFRDRMNLVLGYKIKDRGFHLASWIQDSSIPITFLSSETLVAELFTRLGFEIIQLGVSKFDHNVNIFSTELLNKSFFKVMNKNVVWNTLDYDLIVSDCINGYFEASKQTSLEVEVITHQSIRGSNSHRGKRILTVISHIPQTCIVFIHDVLNTLGSNMSYKETEQLFYRDRLCQAVGRVLGYRAVLNEPGETPSTDVVVHSSLYASLSKASFPYNFVDWDWTFNNKDNVFKEIERRNKDTKVSPRAYRSKNIQTFEYLDLFFEKDKNGYLTATDVKTHLVSGKLKPVAATKIARYFNCTMGNKRIGDKSYKVIFGLSLKH